MPSACRRPASSAGEPGLKSKGQASSELSPQYGHAACTPIARCRQSAWRGWQQPSEGVLSLQWPAAVRVAEIVYYGRTAFDWYENWKDHSYFDGGRQRSPRARSAGARTPAVMTAQPAKVSATLKFLSRAPNPAFGDQVYAAASEEQLGRFTLALRRGTAGEPGLVRRAIKDRATTSAT
jgi:hypothetical protein